jgi:formate/nitrite transporter FocA (FNT family)
MIFILIGAEHCIADFPYLLFNLSPINVLKFAFIVLGNSIGAILIERLSK